MATAAVAAPSALALADEVAASAGDVEGYTFYETDSGLQVTVADDENPSLPTVVVLATGGMIEGYNLPPQKAVAPLRLALAVTSNLDEIQEMFKRY